MTIYSVITGTGRYIPTKNVKNEDFLNSKFYDSYDKVTDKPNQEIIDKFLEITTIAERRYATEDLLTSDLAFFAAEKAIAKAGIDKETLDYVIVAHNFGDVRSGSNRTDNVPSLAARVKYKLGIENPSAIAYDILFGCPGWLQAFIQADYYIRSGDAKRILVIGADVLSRIADPHDRDSMLYADGAGAVILEARESSTPIGILGHVARSDTKAYLNMLNMAKSFRTQGATSNTPAGNSDSSIATNNESSAFELDPNHLYLKMNGRRLYQYALETVPLAIKAALDKCGVHINEISKVLIHQANGKMDEAILKRLYALYNISEIPANVMPMSISYLGNSSVATLPTLLDLIMRDSLSHAGEALNAIDTDSDATSPATSASNTSPAASASNTSPAASVTSPATSASNTSPAASVTSPATVDVHSINKGDKIVFASVGAGMNINALVYIA